MNSRKRIYVVDDDPGILEVIKIILEEKGFEVITFSEGSRMRRAFKTSVPDIILLDLWMSESDGEKIIQNLKRQKELSHIPIIAISALSDGARRAKEAGADDFLAKPFNIDDLVLMVEKYTS